MRKQLSDLGLRLDNLRELLTLVTRYGEEDLQRSIRDKIELLEREYKILKVKIDYGKE